MRGVAAQNVARRFGITLLSVVLVATAFVTSPRHAPAAPTFTFNGGGWGHGIGLSQYGAAGFAKQGESHSWILNHFYAGTRLETKTWQPVVKVNLDDGASARSRWRIQSGTSGSSLTISQISSSTTSATVSSSQSCWITVSGSNVVLSKDAVVNGSHQPGTVIKKFSGGVEVKTDTRADSLVQIKGDSGPFNHGDVKWRGFIRFEPFTSTTAKAVNHLYIQSYLYGVVPREMPASWCFKSSSGTWVDSNNVRWNIEALKAQAVAARSYAWQDAVSGNVLKCTTASQVYNGYSGADGSHEPPATTAAVQQTKGEVVWYGDESVPVKTYFSSSSGGRTASIENVWTGATPKPYYKSASDADQSGPHYTWTRSIGSTTLSSRIRSLDGSTRDYSAPSPAYITSISLERAGSGHAHHATLRWSNGSSYRITGTTLQAGFNYGVSATASRLLSTKFSLSGGSISSTRFEQTNTKIAWSGLWTAVENDGLYGGSSYKASAKGAEAIVKFKGTGFTWIGTKAKTYGMANVYIDGKYAATAKLYSSTTKYKQRLFSRTGLSNGSHTAVIRVLGERYSGSTGTNVSVDSVTITEGSLEQATLAPTRYEEADVRLRYNGTWASVASAGKSGGAHVYTSQHGAFTYGRFTGTGARWIARMAPEYGRARVWIDAQGPDVVSLSAASPLEQQVVWSKSGLEPGYHTILIEAMGPEAGADPGSISVDAIEVVGDTLQQPVVPRVRAQDSLEGLVWDGDWLLSESSRVSGGTQRYQDTYRTAAAVRFTGTGASWIGNKAPNYGKANVYVDGSYAATVNLYSSAQLFKLPLFSVSGLSMGEHTLKVMVLGQHDSRSTGNRVSVDAFDVWGAPL